MRHVLLLGLSLCATPLAAGWGVVIDHENQRILFMQEGDEQIDFRELQAAVTDLMAPASPVQTLVGGELQLTPGWHLQLETLPPTP